MDDSEPPDPEHTRFPSEYGLRKTIKPGEARVLGALGHLHKIAVERFYHRRRS